MPATVTAEPRSAPPQAMVVWPDHLAFVGPMGRVPVRTMGSLTILVALDAPFLFRGSKGDWEMRSAAVIPPYVPHEFIAERQILGALMIEPEAVQLPAAELLLSSGALPERLRDHLAALFSSERATSHERWASREVADAFIKALGPRRLDPRIACSVAAIRARPEQRHAAEVHAQAAGLSFSRFLHLFRAETTISFRRFVAWKRARHVLENLRSEARLTDLALSAGYPDASHFSHSLRDVYGLQPREMFARCSKLVLASSPA